MEAGGGRRTRFSKVRDGTSRPHVAQLLPAGRWTPIHALRASVVSQWFVEDCSPHLECQRNPA